MDVYTLANGVMPMKAAWIYINFEINICSEYLITNCLLHIYRSRDLNSLCAK